MVVDMYVAYDEKSRVPAIVLVYPFRHGAAPEDQWWCWVLDLDKFLWLQITWPEAQRAIAEAEDD